jgi:enolase-phosphatase E1
VAGTPPGPAQAMNTFHVAAVVTDIEGTTTDIAFVHDVLFPYAREHMAAFLRDHAHVPAVREQILATAKLANLDPADLNAVSRCLLDWIAQDRKFMPLKALQGMIWKTGYRTGAFTGHVYADAHHALKIWHAQGIPLYVYSSGSVGAQKLLYGHSDFGDMSAWFEGYFDTQVGGKRETASYETIAKAIAQPANHILFLSDVVEELDAAHAAGWQCLQLLRNPNMVTGPHPTAASFSEIKLDSAT